MGLYIDMDMYMYMYIDMEDVKYRATCYNATVYQNCFWKWSYA